MSRTILCAVSALAFMAATPWSAVAGFRGSVVTNELMILEFAGVAGPPTGTIAAVTIIELGDDRIRGITNLSLELLDVTTVQIMPSKNTRRIVIEVDVGPFAFTRVRAQQLGVPLFPDEAIGEDTRYVLDVR